MPKLKTHRGAAKRFRRTATGFKRKQTNKNHILTKKAPKRKRQLWHGKRRGGRCTSVANYVAH